MSPFSQESSKALDFCIENEHHIDFSRAVFDRFREAYETIPEKERRFTPEGSSGRGGWGSVYMRKDCLSSYTSSVVVMNNT